MIHAANLLDTRTARHLLGPRMGDNVKGWHRFPQSYLTHCQDTGSYDGPSYTDFLPFDFDGDDLSTVLKRVQEFLKMLQITYEIEGLHGIRCYFSGKKGFHILLSSHLFGGWQFPYSVFLLLKVTHRAIR